MKEYVRLDQRECSNIVETVRVLLAAGSNTDGPEGHRPLDILLKLALQECIVIGNMDMPVHLSFALLTDLIHLLLKNGAVGTRENPGHVALFVSAAAMLEGRSERIATQILLGMYQSLYIFHHDVIDEIREFKRYNRMMDSFCEMFRCLVLSGAEGDGPHNVFTDKFVSKGEFFVSFTSIVQYSTEFQQSNKFVQLLLSSLSAAQVNILKKALSANVNERSPRQAAAYALVDAIETPIGLQRLAHRAVVRAMSYRSLNSGASTLVLPTSLLPVSY